MGSLRVWKCQEEMNLEKEAGPQSWSVLWVKPKNLDFIWKLKGVTEGFWAGQDINISGLSHHHHLSNHSVQKSECHPQLRTLQWLHPLQGPMWPGSLTPCLPQSPCTSSAVAMLACSLFHECTSYIHLRALLSVRNALIPCGLLPHLRANANLSMRPIMATLFILFFILISNLFPT